MFSRIKKIIFSKTFIVAFSLLLSISMITGSYLYKVKRTNAYCITQNGMICFGGQVTFLELCCNGIKLYVGTETYMWIITTRLYMWWNPTMGQCVLGDAYISGVCLTPLSWPPCSGSSYTLGTIRQMGTTLSGCAG